MSSAPVSTSLSPVAIVPVTTVSSFTAAVSATATGASLVPVIVIVAVDVAVALFSSRIV